MRKNKNNVKIIGYVYQNDEKRGLKINTVKKVDSPSYGKEFISGTIHVAVDEDGMNVIPVVFTYVTADGRKESTYKVLKSIIENPESTWILGGKEKALQVDITGSIGVNDFYSDRTNSIVSDVRVEGGFISLTSNVANKPEKERHKFNVDMVINKVTHIDADPEKNINEDYIKIGGAVFNFRNELIPLSLAVRNEAGMNYFEGLDASPSNPIYTNVWGKVNCMTIKVEKTIESAFGDPEVQVYENKSREYLVTGSIPDPYDFGDEQVMTAEELKKAAQDREIKMASVKKDFEDRKSQKEAELNKPVVIAEDNFDF